MTLPPTSPVLLLALGAAIGCAALVIAATVARALAMRSALLVPCRPYAAQNPATDTLAVYCNDATTPIKGADVWITNDVDGVDGETVVAGPLTTNDSGEATFALDSGNYWAHIQDTSDPPPPPYVRRMAVTGGGFAWTWRPSPRTLAVNGVREPKP